jgi:hypothetical protein
MENKSGNWGGNREGAGRKTADLSKREVMNMVRAFKSMAKKYKKTVWEILAEFAYDENENTRYRLKAIEIYMTASVVKHVHKTVENIEGPQIMLPPLREKPKPDFHEVEHRVH